MLSKCGLENTFESLLDSKEIKSVHLEGNHPCLFIGRTDTEAEVPILRPPTRRANSLEKIPMLGKTEGRRRMGATEDEMVGWHHRHNGYEFEQTAGDTEGQGSPVYCSPWDRKESDTT